MVAKVKKHLFPALVYALNLVSALFWVALRINYSGISKFLGADTNPTFLIMNLPLMACALAWIGFFLALAGLFTKAKWPRITGLVIGLVTFIGGGVVVYFGAWDYLSFILHHFYKTLAAGAALTAGGLLLLFPIPNRSKGVWIGKGAAIALVCLLCIVMGYQLRPCTFTYEPVVYAVEDQYQIVFSTSDSALGWVTVGDQAYYDLYAGSARSADRVHKITLPQQVLDDAGGYTIHAQQMIYRGPFGGYKGQELTKSYEFRPVDSSDGLDYVAMSDVHGAVDAAAKAARYENLDYIILLGDLVSMVETQDDAQIANRLAFAVTGGEIPVIYVRGNHEIKGEYGEELYKYVGSKNQQFSYWVTLGQDVFSVVLDMGEDHEDDWWEYYGTAHFDLYRQQQSEMLEEILADGNYVNYEYRMALCHIPVTFLENSKKFEAFRLEWTDLLNRLEVDVSLSGHKHKVWFYDSRNHVPGESLVYSEGYAGKTGKKAGGSVTDANFPTFLVGQRSLTQTGGTQGVGLTDYLCLHTHVYLKIGKQTSRYINSRGQTVEVFYPFDHKEAYQAMDRIETDLHN